MSTPEQAQLAEHMLKQYGPLMGGTILWQALGFKTHAAFGRAKRSGLLGLAVFEIPGRRGQFALTTDVAYWLLQSKEKGKRPMS